MGLSTGLDPRRRSGAHREGLHGFQGRPVYPRDHKRPMGNRKRPWAIRPMTFL